MKGFKTCPTWLKKKYREAVNYICQECKRHENKVKTLIPHRIIRKNKGGLYTVVPLNHIENNVKIVCAYDGEIDEKISCHKLFHQGEFPHISN